MSEDKVECPRCVRGQALNPALYGQVELDHRARVRMAMREIDEGSSRVWLKGSKSGQNVRVDRLIPCRTCDGTGHATKEQAAAYLLETTR